MRPFIFASRLKCKEQDTPWREDWWRWENTRGRKVFSNFSKITHQSVAQIKCDTWFLTEWLRGWRSFSSSAKNNAGKTHRFHERVLKGPLSRRWLESLPENKTTVQHPWSPAIESRLVIGVTVAWCELDPVGKLWSTFWSLFSLFCSCNTSVATWQFYLQDWRLMRRSPVCLDFVICWQRREIAAPGRNAALLFKWPGNLSFRIFIITSAGFGFCLIYSLNIWK